MKSDAGDNASVWTATTDMPAGFELARDEEADVCVIGAGIAGLTTAYRLAGEGNRVIVLDDGPVAGGESSRTTAHLTSYLDEGYQALERLHGEHGARLAAASHEAAIETIERIVAAEGIRCDFMRVAGYLFCPPGESDGLLGRELEASRRAGVSAEYVEHVPIQSCDLGPAVRFADQGQFHVLKYLNGLAQALVQRGGRIYAHSGVRAIEDTAHPRVRTSAGHCVSARSLVVATHSPINDRFAIHTKLAPYRTYVIAARIAAGSVPALLAWDTEDPYHYVRMQPGNGRAGGHDWLIVGGEDHKSGQGDDHDSCYAALEQWTRVRFPVIDVPLHWSGQIMEPVDGLAFIGRNPGDEHVYIATGDSGNGMTHGTIAGILIADLIAGRRNEWAKLYDPSRKTLRSMPGYAAENLNVASQYADYVTKGDVDSLDDLAPGEGAVLRRGLAKVAVYRDEGGALHEHSAVCTHLGCIVRWNDTEMSWDCPCHGSRFDKIDGHVIHGPAITGLKNAATKE